MNETPPSGAPVKFDLKFTPEVDLYIEDCRKQQIKPTVKGFATRIGTDLYSVWAWADKKKKDEKGQPTNELARPKFKEALTKLYELEKQIEEEVRPKLNEKQELFCQLYATSHEYFGNGKLSYMLAYGMNIDDKAQHNSAAASASKLLTNLNVASRVAELLGAITEEIVDAELAYVIRQREELPSKVAAIREWNKVKSRVTDKLDLTSKGEKVAQVVGFRYVTPEDVTDRTDNQTNA